MYNRRQWCQAVVMSAIGIRSQAQSMGPDVPLPHTASLHDALQAALGQHKALLVMASLEGCGFCRIARTLHLWPLHRAGQPMVQLEMRSATPVIDFKGQPSTHDELLRRWRIRVAPTLLFIGAGGQEVAERMEGAGLPDFYGAYLEDRMQRANATV